MRMGMGYVKHSERHYMPGVEPGSQAWEACMIPLHYMRLSMRNATASKNFNLAQLQRLLNNFND